MNTSDSPLRGRSILIVEDDPSLADRLTLNLSEHGLVATKVRDVQGAKDAIDQATIPFDIALVDFYLPDRYTDDSDRVLRGEQLAYGIRDSSPRTLIVGMSAFLEREPRTPIDDLFAAFIFKEDLASGKSLAVLFETLEGILVAGRTRGPKTFIVHGHDDALLRETKDYLQNTLGLGEPTVLRERPSAGRTVIEKFEQESRDIDLVFVLMTPDDPAAPGAGARRARANVILELGFFYAKLQRSSGSVILLTKGELEIPTDISGIVYIDVTAGVAAKGEEIRRELRDLGWIS